MDKTTLIGEILINEGIVSAEQLNEALEVQKQTGEHICSALIKLGYSSEERIFGALSRQLNVPYVKIKERKIEPVAIQKISSKLAIHYKIFPLELQNNTLAIAMANPSDIKTIDEINLRITIPEVEYQLALVRFNG